MEVVEAMREWAGAQNLLVKPRVISAYLMNGSCKEEPAHYLDVYISPCRDNPTDIRTMRLPSCFIKRKGFGTKPAGTFPFSVTSLFFFPLMGHDSITVAAEISPIRILYILPVLLNLARSVNQILFILVLYDSLSHAAFDSLKTPLHIDASVTDAFHSGSSSSSASGFGRVLH